MERSTRRCPEATRRVVVTTENSVDRVIGAISLETMCVFTIHSTAVWTARDGVFRVHHVILRGILCRRPVGMTTTAGETRIPVHLQDVPECPRVRSPIQTTTSPANLIQDVTIVDCTR